MAHHHLRSALLEPSTRRAFLARAGALGLAAAVPGALLVACGGRKTASSRAATSGSPAGQLPTMTMPTPGASTANASPVSGTSQVVIQNFAFAPPALSVPVGTTITWTNEDDVPHTVTAQDKRYTSPALDTNDTYSHTFDAPGVYAYYCAIHPVMTGRIVVQ